MKKLLLTLLFFISNLSFSQTDKDNYEIYNKIISEQLKFGIENKTDTIILIEDYSPKFSPDFDSVISFTSDSIPDWAINNLAIQTNQNGAFIQRMINDYELKNAIKNFTTDFQNHPKINVEFLKSDKLNIQAIPSQKYYSYFGKKFKRIEKSWKRFKKKYGTIHVIEFSKIKYYKNFAIIYYEHHCGGLCGSGKMIVFENNNGKWEILSEINFWKA